LGYRRGGRPSRREAEYEVGRKVGREGLEDVSGYYDERFGRERRREGSTQNS
jgi:hypothetical protein